ncbi:hypothetical protein EUTSA_v10028167mg [Eutrema salsugineum]|uniref:CCHC-type domain-containing protein n=1 Tax=Eutrema salsugineum TaxID=72664 RepID=V4M550_EUTSA|nr:hypothetical protein EUTSA_v10028167mg [Eutrema salsugineum]
MSLFKRGTSNRSESTSSSRSDTIKRHRENGFKYIHIGLVQVGIKPLSKEGLNTSILAILRDTRFKIFEDSLLSSTESISLKDKNILKSLVLQVKTHNYEMIARSIPIAIIFRVHYKAMMSAFSSKVKISSKNGVVQPKPTKPNEPLEPNTRLKHIEQFHDGKVKLSFIRNHHETIDDYTCESSSLPETIDLGRVSQLAQDFSRIENCPKFQPRFSTSDIPNSVLRNVDFRTQIPKPPTSPTFSAVTDNMINELNVLEKDFQIDKEFLRDEFYSKNNTQKRLWFFKNFLKNRNLIQEEFYKYLYKHKMTMTANAYRTQVGNEDRTVAEDNVPILDNYLNNQQRSQILDAVKTDEDNVPILDNFGNSQQDAVATLIIAITLHFIGDPSVLRDKNAELLSNLKCKRLSDFQWYKNTFLTRVLLRQDSNQPFWKEKFFAGLPTLLGEKVRNKIRDSTGTQIIEYDDFTCGELISIVQQEGLKICQDLKLQKHLKWELKRTKVELGSFCRQFEIDPSKNSKSCIGDCSNSYYSNNKPRKYSKTYRNHKSHENSWQKPRKRFTPKEITNSKPFYKNLTCFKCNKKGHTSKFCRFNRKIQELGLGEELSSKISNLLLDHSSSSSNESDSSLSSEKALQVDELKNSSSGSESDENKINKQSFLPLTKKIKISENTSKPHNPTSSKSSYDLTTILNKRKKDSSKTTIQDLRMEIKEVKNDLKTLREKQKRDSEYFHSIISSIKGNHDSSSDEQDNDNLDNIEDDISLKEQIQSLDSAPKDFLSFWNRKQHIVDLPYEGNFNEKEIPTKARPIQMNSELEKHCRKEISDLLYKGLISKSRSPWHS